MHMYTGSRYSVITAITWMCNKIKRMHKIGRLARTKVPSATFADILGTKSYVSQVGQSRTDIVTSP